MLVALVAAVTMLLTDCLATVMVQMEAANHGWIAGFLDAAGWIVSIACTAISVNVLTGHNNTREKILVITFVTVANVLGTKLGQVLGSRILKTKGERLIAAAARSGR